MEDEITKARKARIKKVRKRRTAWFLTALCLVLAAVILANTITTTTFKDIGDFFSALLVASKSYPVEISEAHPRQVEQLSLSYAVLTEKEMKVFSDRGNELQTYEHGFVSPLISASGNRIALFNSGGKEIKIFNRTKEIATVKTDYTIVSAEVSSYGTLAVLTTGDRYLSGLEIYGNGKYERLMTWYGSKGFPLMVKMQNMGNKAAVATISSVNGEIVSTVTAIDTAAAKELFTCDVTGLAVKLWYDSNGYITLVTDEQTVVITSKGEIKYTFGYGDAPLLFASCDEGRNIALCFGDNQRPAINTLTVLGSNLTEKYTAPSVGEVKDVYINGSGVYLLGDGRATRYSLSGEVVSTYEADGEALRLVVCGRILTVLPDRIEKVKKQ